MGSAKAEARHRGKCASATASPGISRVRITPELTFLLFSSVSIVFTVLPDYDGTGPVLQIRPPAADAALWAVSAETELPYSCIPMSQVDQIVAIVNRIGTVLLVLGILAVLAVSVMQRLERRKGPDSDDLEKEPRRRQL